MRTLVAHVGVTAENCRAAGHDRFDHFLWLERQSMLRPVVRAVTPKNVSQFQGWPRHGGGLALGFLNGFGAGAETWVQPVKRTMDLADQKRRDLGVASSGFNPGVAE